MTTRLTRRGERLLTALAWLSWLATCVMLAGVLAAWFGLLSP